MTLEYARGSKAAVKQKGKRKICYISAKQLFHAVGLQRLPPAHVPASTFGTGFNFRKSSMRLLVNAAQSFRLKPMMYLTSTLDRSLPFADTIISGVALAYRAVRTSSAAASFKPSLSLSPNGHPGLRASGWAHIASAPFLAATGRQRRKLNVIADVDRRPPRGRDPRCRRQGKPN
jgi:hypothetical protein